MNRCVAIALLALVACDDAIDELDPPDVEGAEGTVAFRPSGAPPEDAPIRVRNHKVRSLVDDAARVELRQRGLVIDLGTPDQHKFMPPWQRGTTGAVEVFEGRPALEVDGELILKFDVREKGVARLVVRARSIVGRQTLLVYVDGKHESTRRLGQTFKEHDISLDDALRPGFHEVRLALRGGRKHRMWLDYVYVPSGKKSGEPPLSKVAVRKHGVARESLIGDPPRTYSLWTEVPENGKFIFDYASDGSTSFEVAAIIDRVGRRKLFESSGAPRFRESTVDLSKWAGELIRLELVTRGTGTASWGDPWIAKPGRPPTPPPPAKKRPRGVIVYVIDTMRQDAFKLFNPKSRVRTPAYDKLAEESVVFDNAYTTAPWTKPSVATILSGLYPSSHGAQTEEAKISSKLLLLSEILQARGFKTGLYSANGYVSDYFGFTQGWDDYVNFPRLKERTQADNVLPRAFEWLKGVPEEQPFFLYLQTIDPHVPYQTPGRHLSLYLRSGYKGALGKTGDAVTGYHLEDFNEGKLELTADDRRYLVRSYYAEITYHDEYFGKFIDELKHADLLDDVLLVVTNDHGEELFDHDKLDHGQSLYDELIRSPMLMRYPALLEPRRYKAPVSIVDIAPTVLDALGIPPPAHMQGRSLLHAARGGRPVAPAYAVAERQDGSRAIRFGPYKLILTAENDTELYDLRKDRGETKNLARYRPVALRACETHLFEALAIPRALDRPNGMNAVVRHEVERAKLDKDFLEHLQALGYFND